MALHLSPVTVFIVDTSFMTSVVCRECHKVSERPSSVSVAFQKRRRNFSVQMFNMQKMSSSSLNSETVRWLTFFRTERVVTKTSAEIFLDKMLNTRKT